MLYRSMYKELHEDLSVLRLFAVAHGNVAIEENNHSAYCQAEMMYDQITKVLTKHYKIFESQMPHEQFPEWPLSSMRPVFSDEEIASWPAVMFSDGSYVDDSVDVPF